MPIIDILSRADAVPAPALSGLPNDVPYDRRPIPALGMIAIKLYAFGGLAFLVGTVLTAISYWIWVVIINREYADSPPWLDLHPERMRAREVARVARLKAKKEGKRQERARKEKEKEENFSPPPIKLEERDNRNRSSSAPISSATIKAGAIAYNSIPIAGDNMETALPKSSSVSISSTLGKNTTTARPKSSSVSTIGKASLLNAGNIHQPPGATARPRKSSFAGSAFKSQSPDKRVSWASSTATLDVNGCEDVMPISGKSAEPSWTSKKVDWEDQDNDPSRTSVLMPIPSHADLIRALPAARTASPRVSVAIDPHARQGPEMIAAITQDVARNWAREVDRYDENGYCRCWGPGDGQGRQQCEVHASR